MFSLLSARSWGLPWVLGQVTQASVCLFLHLRKKDITCHLPHPRGRKLTVEKLFEISRERCNLSRSMPIIYFYYPF